MLRLSVLLLGLLWAAGSSAVGVSLAWDASTDPTVTGYWMYVGTAPRAYTQKLDAGAALTYVVPALSTNQMYYFTVTARNAAGTESVYSNEVSINVPTLPAPSAPVLTL